MYMYLHMCVCIYKLDQALCLLFFVVKNLALCLLAYSHYAQGFETRTKLYGPTKKTVNLSPSRFFKLKNRSTPKKRKPFEPQFNHTVLRTVIRPLLTVPFESEPKKNKNKK